MTTDRLDYSDDLENALTPLKGKKIWVLDYEEIISMYTRTGERCGFDVLGEFHLPSKKLIKYLEDDSIDGAIIYISPVINYLPGFINGISELRQQGVPVVLVLPGPEWNFEGEEKWKKFSQELGIGVTSKSGEDFDINALSELANLY